MATFTDAKDREWAVEVTVGTIKRVRSLIDVDLLDLSDGSNMITRLAIDPILLCNVLFVVCKPQADEAGVTDEQFGEALFGDALEAATNAMLEALVSFFPPRQRPALMRALEKMQELTEMGVAAAEKILESGQVEAAMQAEIDAVSIGGTKSGASPESSGLTPVL